MFADLQKWNVLGTLFKVFTCGLTSRLASGLSESSIFLTPPPFGSMIEADTGNKRYRLYRGAEESKRRSAKKNGYQRWTGDGDWWDQTVACIWDLVYAIYVKGYLPCHKTSRLSLSPVPMVRMQIAVCLDALRYSIRSVLFIIAAAKLSYHCAWQPSTHKMK